VPLPVLEQHFARFIASELAKAAKQEREEPQRARARLIQAGLVLTVDTKT
jgi:hypothetical protein